MSISYPPSFVVKISGNPSNISLILNCIDPKNGPTIYPLTCLDGYHFEDATVTIATDERMTMALVSATRSNIRGSL